MTDATIRMMKEKIERYQTLKLELKDIEDRFFHLQNINPTKMILRGDKFRNDCSVLNYDQLKLTSLEGMKIRTLLKEILTEKMDMIKKEIEELDI